MNNFELNETKGRTLLKSFLNQAGATDQHETEDIYNPVDYYFTYNNKKAVAEIKVRDIKYKDYPTHLMEVSKYDALVRDKKEKELDVAYYVNFFIDNDTITAYLYSTSTISKYAIPDTKYCNRTTAIYTGKTGKDVLLIPTDKAQKFVRINNRWSKGI